MYVSIIHYVIIDSVIMCVIIIHYASIDSVIMYVIIIHYVSIDSEQWTNKCFVTNKSVTWVEVGVHDYVIVEHLQIADNQGDAALRMGNSEASPTLYQIRFLLLQSLSIEPQYWVQYWIQYWTQY